MHVDSVVEPVVPEYLPALQSVHTVGPVALLYFPASHATHGPPLGPVKPAAQSLPIHAVLAVLATGEVVPVGQVKHDAGPVPVLYCPAKHAVHSPPLAPLKPALH